MKLVRHVLLEKGDKIHAVSPGVSVLEALKIMSQHDIGALLVKEGDSVHGIFSERDYARKVILQGRSSSDLTVREIMSDKVYFIKPENSVEECMAVMTNKKVRHLPVMDGEKLTGIVSIGDVVKALIEEHNFTIDQLVNYIKGA